MEKLTNVTLVLVLMSVTSMASASSFGEPGNNNLSPQPSPTHYIYETNSANKFSDSG